MLDVEGGVGLVSNGVSTKALSLDAAAWGVSGLCLVHCLALPILSVTLPVFAGVTEAEWLHKVFVGLAIPISIGAIFRNGRLPASSRKAFAAVVVTGLTLLTLAAFAEPLHDWEVLLTTIGAVLIASAHLWRWRALRSV